MALADGVPDDPVQALKMGGAIKSHRMGAEIEAAPRTGRWTGEFRDRQVEDAYRAATAVEHGKRVKLLTFIAVPVELGLLAACYHMVGTQHAAFYWLVALRLLILALAGYLVLRMRGNAKRIGKDAILVAGFMAHLGTLWILADQVPRLSPEMFQLQFNLAVFALSSLLFFSWRARLLTTLAIAAAIVPIYAIAIPAVTGRTLASHASDVMVIILFIGTAYISARALEIADRQRYLALLEHQKREVQARDLANARRELIELVSHNYRQPLHALAFYIEAAARLGGSPDETLRSQFAEVIGKQRQVVGALREDLQRLLDYIRLDSGFVRPQRREFPIDEIRRHVEQVHGGRARETGVAVRCRIARGRRAVGDFTLICTMLDALVNNAVAYSDPAKSRRGVVVAVRQRAGALLVEVVDNGIGIADGDLAQLGRAYFRGSPASEAAAGTGLGLAIVYRLADVLRGDCAIRSRLGRGTAVRLSLPTEPDSRNTLPGGLAAEPEASHAGDRAASERPVWV